MPIELIERFIVACDHCQDRLKTTASPDVDFTVFDSASEARDAARQAGWALGPDPHQATCPDCQIELARAAEPEIFRPDFGPATPSDSPDAP